MKCSNPNAGIDFFNELDRNLNRLVRNVLQPDSARSESAEAATLQGMTVLDDGEMYVVELDLPGVVICDLSIEINDRILSITGERKLPVLPEGATLILDERGYGKFSRSVQLAKDADAEQIDAVYSDGVLRIAILKVQRPAAQKIAIRSPQCS